MVNILLKQQIINSILSTHYQNESPALLLEAIAYNTHTEVHKLCIYPNHNFSFVVQYIIMSSIKIFLVVYYYPFH